VKYYWGDEMKDDHTGGECGKNMGEDLKNKVF
jgi:hypothetical protein